MGTPPSIPPLFLGATVQTDSIIAVVSNATTQHYINRLKIIMLSKVYMISKRESRFDDVRRELRMPPKYPEQCVISVYYMYYHTHVPGAMHHSGILLSHSKRVSRPNSQRF